MKSRKMQEGPGGYCAPSRPFPPRPLFCGVRADLREEVHVSQQKVGLDDQRHGVPLANWLAVEFCVLEENEHLAGDRIAGDGYIGELAFEPIVSGIVGVAAV